MCLCVCSMYVHMYVDIVLHVCIRMYVLYGCVCIIYIICITCVFVCVLYICVNVLYCMHIYVFVDCMY